MRADAYYKAPDLQSAWLKLKEDRSNVILGGGQWLKKMNGQHQTLIDVSGLGLDFITEHGPHIQIGALTTLRRLETDPLIKGLAHGLLSLAVGQIMGVSFRNLATIGGTLVGRYPFSDLITPLLTLETTLVFYPERKVTLAAYLAERTRVPEILVSVFIKKSTAKSFFKKVRPTALAFPILNIAITSEDGRPSIAIGARPLTGALAQKAMDHLLVTKDPAPIAYKKAAEIAAEELAFQTTTTATKEYRKLLAVTYVERGLKEVMPA